MNDETPRRALGFEEMNRRRGMMFKPGTFAESVRRYRARPSDVIFSPYPKCGTTWLQQAFHTLRTRGDMDFDDISQVIPWIETSAGMGVDINADQRANPRGFKSHLPYHPDRKGPRYVVSLRDPKDALVSMFRFMEGWWLEPGAMTASQFADELLRSRADGYWGHLVSWWEQRDNPDVLLLSYEHMSAEPEVLIRKLAAFCGIPLDDELLALTLERSSIEYMLIHKDRFEDKAIRALSERRGNLPPGSDVSKVRLGKVGSHRDELGPRIIARLENRWTRLITPRFGFPNYAAMDADLRRRNS